MSKKRITIELQKLYNSKYKVDLKNNTNTEFDITIKGPEDSPFSGAFYKVHFLIPEDYPYKSPSIGFVTKIFHPNVDETSGSICLDVLNQVWSPMYDLFNIVEIFIPQLLTYPNPSDPLNCEAGSLYLNNYEKYVNKVEEYKKKYGIPIEKEIEEKDEETSLSSSDNLDL
ncbi:ubiquitin-conjugating enzyme E2 [Vairimorpha necatrix]|uniref:Ubiquitin-conjugating enzyme E2 H n=1 Tax=Vairimorpha necatrix TaxID=6039 RepID=A0AAX4JDE7_9MICR